VLDSTLGQALGQKIVSHSAAATFKTTHIMAKGNNSHKKETKKPKKEKPKVVATRKTN
jgi:hypothetical protein